MLEEASSNAYSRAMVCPFQAVRGLGEGVPLSIFIVRGRPPTRQPSQRTAMLMATSTTAMLIRESVLKSVSVPLLRPVNPRPMTGKTGTPQPERLQGPVVRPITLVNAPATPAGRAAFAPRPQASPACLRYDQRAK